MIFDFHVRKISSMTDRATHDILYFFYFSELIIYQQCITTDYCFIWQLK